MKLQLSGGVNLQSGQNLNDLMKSNRKFSSISENLFLTGENLGEFLKAKGIHIRRLNWTHSSTNKFHDILKCVPNLEHLEITRGRLAMTEKVSLANLKTLVLDLASQNILQLIDDTSKLKEITFFGGNGYNAENARFIIKCSNLQELSAPLSFTLEEIDQIQFRLKKLSIKTDGGSFDENLLSKFLSLHENSLEDIRIKQPIPVPICNQIFTQFKHCRKLELDGDNLPDEQAFYLCLEPLSSVRELTIKSGIHKHRVAVALLTLFPLLEVLRFESFKVQIWFSKFLKSIPRRDPNLLHLKIHEFSKSTSVHMLFKNLKSIEVDSVQWKEPWLNFVLSHRNLEKIVVKSLTANLSNDDIQQVMQLPCLKYIEVGGEVKELKAFYEVVRKDFKNLCSIKFELLPARKKLTIDIPSERQSWNSEKYNSYFE